MVADAPNISLNSHNQFWRGELRTAAILGTILQLGVLIYSAFTTYYHTLRFKNDGQLIQNYAFSCTAVGTLILIAGMLFCGHVVESSTDEERFQPTIGTRARLVWLQKPETVSDQVFDSFAIFPKDDRVFITTSSRAMSRKNERPYLDPGDMIRTITLGCLGCLGCLGAINGHGQTLLAFKTVVGTIITLCGFLVQFMGFRGMHWSVSITQLAAGLIMAVVRAVVRRGLANPPLCQRLSPGFELEWFAITLRNPGRAPWRDSGISDGNIHDRWIVVTGEGAHVYQQLRQGNGAQSTHDDGPNCSMAHRVMNIRRDSVNWHIGVGLHLERPFALRGRLR